MKFKKSFSMFFVFVMVLVFSQNAFAAVGVGDTKESAINLFPPSSIELYISNSKDKNWFTWTNNTGKMKMLTSFLNPSSDSNKFRLGFLMEYINGRKTDLLYASTLPSHIISNIYIPDGAKLYIVVDKIDDYMTQYRLGFLIDDIL
ncbi:hypothetical protein [Paenibacillus sp. OSY-SE]|uniref:hypothetical protein n=1 Tax=Paenibacillus sp. OSY-SE TaxID=1196323 RepID=UPI00030B9AC9|nr:hypothetical protein [Paenibacillus sp. OSY-SE]